MKTQVKSYFKRTVFLFFIIMSIPWNWRWYTDLLGIDWTSLHYRDLYDIARFQPAFRVLGQWLPSWYGYSDWVVVLLLALLGAVIWTALDRKERDFNKLFYWLMVVVRYRAGIGIIGFAFTKVLPVQMPFPSEGILNTNFGDLTQQKIYWLSIGIVPWYQVFTGLVELAAGVMLFFRKTTFYGAALLTGALGSITYVNFAYEGGVHIYASYFVLYGLFILSYYVPRIYRLMIRQEYTVPVNDYPSFDKTWQQVLRVGLKAGVILLFLGVLFYVQLLNFWYDPYKQPSSPGVAQLRGYYDVKAFYLNSKLIPPALQDSIGWQDLTFEKWSSMSFSIRRPQLLDLSNGGGNPIRDIDRNFEIAGVGGGRRVFHYYADTIDRVLYLQDKKFSRDGESVADPADKWISDQTWQRLGNENEWIDPRGATARRSRAFETAPREVSRKRMVLHYESNSDGSQITLSGLNDEQDSIRVLLERKDRKYILTRSTLDAGQYGGVSGH